MLGAGPAPAMAPAHPGGQAGSRTLLGQSTRVSRPVPAVSFSHFPSMHAAGLPSLLRSAPAILSPVSPALAMHFPSPFEISPSLRHSLGCFGARLHVDVLFPAVVKEPRWGSASLFGTPCAGGAQEITQLAQIHVQLNKHEPKC